MHASRVPTCSLVQPPGACPSSTLVQQSDTGVPLPHPGPHMRHQVMAARHLMRRFSAPAAGCCFLCDDDNDLELAAEVGKAFLPSVTSVSRRGARGTREREGRLIKGGAE